VYKGFLLKLLYLGPNREHGTTRAGTECSKPTSATASGVPAVEPRVCPAPLSSAVPCDHCRSLLHYWSCWDAGRHAPPNSHAPAAGALSAEAENPQLLRKRRDLSPGLPISCQVLPKVWVERVMALPPEPDPLHLAGGSQRSSAIPEEQSPGHALQETEPEESCLGLRGGHPAVLCHSRPCSPKSRVPSPRDQSGTKQVSARVQD